MAANGETKKTRCLRRNKTNDRHYNHMGPMNSTRAFKKYNAQRDNRNREGVSATYSYRKLPLERPRRNDYMQKE